MTVHTVLYIDIDINDDIYHLGYITIVLIYRLI